MKFQINRLFVVRWPDKNSGALFLSVLFFVSFFWTSKRKKIHQTRQETYTQKKKSPGLVQTQQHFSMHRDCFFLYQDKKNKIYSIHFTTQNKRNFITEVIVCVHSS